MPYNRNNRNDKPAGREPSKPDNYRKKRVDEDQDYHYDPNDKDELAPPRFLAAPPRFDKNKKQADERPKRPYEKRAPHTSDERPKRAYIKKEAGGFSDTHKKPYEKRERGSFGDKPKRPYEKKTGGNFGERPKRTYEKRDSGDFGDRSKHPFVKKENSRFGEPSGRSFDKRTGEKTGERPKRPYEKKDGETKKPFRPKYDPEVKVKKAYNDAPKKTFSERKKELTGETVSKDDIRLNKYVANSGICSRREADELIKKGLVAVNGKVITEMGHKVKPTDTVTYDGKKILPEPYVYILMNKPKDFLTTTEDEKGRKTVMDLVADKIDQRIFPVGRLDRNTTGVLLLTNDGEVTQALTHPSFEIKKVYQVELDKKATSADLDKLVNGIELEDGEAHADAIAFVESEDKRHVGIEIHSGKNRIVRRMFEHLGYEVVKLDRVSFGIFTKKDLPRGKWRHLTQSEVSFLMKLKSKM